MRTTRGHTRNYWIGVALVVATGCAGASCARARGSAARTGASRGSDTPSQLLRECDGATMILVPGGRYRRGALTHDELALEDERPARWVDVAPFYVDQTEVTRGMFRRFVDATGYVTEGEATGGTNTFPPPGGGNDVLGMTWRSPPPGTELSVTEQEALPVAYVTYQDATAYCRWAEAALPTEAQFEWMLRHGHPAADVYPWGRDPHPPSAFGNYLGEELADAYPDWALRPIQGYRDQHLRAAPVGSYRRDSLGLFDISGNLSEWCRDNWRMYDESPRQSNDSANAVLRGGNFIDRLTTLRCSWRRGGDKTAVRKQWGFRCVRPGPARRGL